MEVEQLERRTLMTLTYGFDAGALTITSDTADFVYLSRDTNGKLIDANGAIPSLDVNADDVTSIVVNGGPGDDDIELWEVGSSLPNVTSVQIFGNGGNDLLVGGLTTDLIDGGDGNDTLYWGGGGQDTLLGGADADRYIFDFNFNNFSTDLNTALGTLQGDISTKAFGNKIPILGDYLSSNEAGQILTTFTPDLVSAAAISGEVGDIQERMFNALNGVGILADGPDADTTVGVNDVIVRYDATGGVQFIAKLHQDPLAYTAPFDLGLPNVPFYLNADANQDLIDVSVGWDMNLSVGVSSTGAFRFGDQGGTDLTVNVTAAPNSAFNNIAGSFGVLIGNATPDNTQTTAFNGAYDFNIKPAGYDTGSLTTTQSEVHLKLDASFTGGASSFDPRLRADLDLTWAFNNADTASLPEPAAEVQRVTFGGDQAGLIRFQIDGNTSTAIPYTPIIGMDIVGSALALGGISGVTVSPVPLNEGVGLDFTWDSPGDHAPIVVLIDSGDITADVATTTPGSSGFGDEPILAFNDVQLDLGTFFTKFVAPIVTEVQSVTKPLQPLVDIINTRVPIISDLAGSDITFGDLIASQGTGGETLVAFVHMIGVINSLVVPNFGDAYMAIGSFTIPDPRGAVEPIDFNSPGYGGRSSVDLLAEADTTTKEKGGDEKSKNFFANAETDSNDGFHFPLLEQPKTVFNAFLGQDAVLFSLDLPVLNAGFEYSVTFYPFGPAIPVGAQLTAAIGFTADLKFGYDTYGLRQYALGGFTDPAQVLDGFYVSDRKNSDGTGEDVPEFTITGDISAALGFFLDLGVVTAEAGIRGGLTATVDFNLHDIPTLSAPQGDGRIRGSEIVAGFEKGPLCIFDITGNIDAYLTLFANIEVDLELFTITIVDESYELARVTLVSFEHSCPDDSSTVELGHMVGDTLYLNTTDDNDSFVVAHKSVDDEPTDGTETLIVRSRGYEQEYAGVRHIVVSEDSSSGDDTSGDDIITIQAGVRSDAELHGGLGDDRLSYFGLASARIYGDDDNDSIVGASGNDILSGGNGDDIISGGAGDDELDGGQGDDKLAGGQGDDTIHGGGGGDRIKGDRGNDTIHTGTGDDTVNWKNGEGSDTIDNDGGDDNLVVATAPGVDTVNISVDGQTLVMALPGQPSGGATIRSTGVQFVDFNTGTGADHVTILGDLTPANLQRLSFNVGTIVQSGEADGGFKQADSNGQIAAGSGAATSSGSVAAADIVNDPIIINGTGGDDVIDISGSDGAILITGLGAPIQLTGLSPDLDTLVINAGEGNDTITAHAGVETSVMLTINGDAGDDTLTGSTGADVLNGGADNDTVTETRDADFALTDATLIVGSEGTDTLTSIERARLYGGASGNAFNITSWTGDATLDGQGGSDIYNITFLDSGAGKTHIADSGASDDGADAANIYANDLANEITLELLSISMGDEQVTYISSLETVDLFALDGDDTITVNGNTAVTNLHGGDGDDTFIVNAATEDTGVAGDHGDDTYVINGKLNIFGDAGFDIIIINLTALNDVLTLDGATLTGAGLDVTYDTVEKLVINGLGGDDTFNIIATEVQTIIHGGAGNDTINGPDVDSNWTITDDNAGTVTGQEPFDFTTFENLNGGLAKDTFIFQDAKTIAGRISGGGGLRDKLDYSNYTTPVLVRFPTGRATSVFGSADDGVSNIEDVTGGINNDTIIGDEQNNTFDGGAGDDFIRGGAGNDTLLDGHGNDSLEGGLGDDTFLLTPGSADVVLDTAGNDTLSFVLAASAITFDLGQNNGQAQVVDLAGDTVAITGRFENLIGSAFNDVLTGSDLAETISGDDGDDTINAAGGDDIVNGDEGNDTLDGEKGDDTIHGNDGDDTIRGGEGKDTLFGDDGEDTIRGGADDDTLRGGDDDDQLFGDGGDDLIAGQQGNDAINGGTGFDTVDFVGSPGGVVVDLVNDVTQDGFGTADTLANIAGAIGTQFPDTLIGDGAKNNLAGGEGDDAINGGGGDDTLVGGPGNDTLQGSGGDDTFVTSPGDDLDNADGGDGNDTVLMVGTDGFDSLSTGLDGTTAIFFRVDGLASVRTTTVETFQANLFGGDDLLTVTDLTGSAVRRVIADLGDGDDLADGSATNVTLDIHGGDGNDTFRGGKGNDAFLGESGIDTIDYSLAPAGVTLTLGRPTPPPPPPVVGPDDPVPTPIPPVPGVTSRDGNGGTDTYFGIENAVGSQFDDILNGDYRNNFINGLGGNDTLRGFDGDDTLVGEAGNDNLQGGIGNDNLSGGEGNDSLAGGGGSNILTGGAGDDFLSQTGSNGVVHYDDSPAAVNINLTLKVKVIDDGFGGHDTFKSVNAVRGSTHNDVIVGGKSAMTLDGGEGDDTLTAGSGKAVLIGGPGTDTLIGGKSADTFLWKPGSDTDIVSAGNKDSIIVEGSSGDDQLAVSSPDGNELRINVEVGATSGLLRALGTNKTTKVTLRTLSGNDTVSVNAFNGLVIKGIVADLGDGDDAAVAAESSLPMTLLGGGGDDFFRPGNAATRIEGGEGFDSIVYDDQTAGISGTLNGTIKLGNKAKHTLRTLESIAGTNFNDKITGTSRADTMYGLEGDDTLSAGGGDDNVFGNGGNDTINGGKGSDHVHGNSGDDKLDGGGHGAGEFDFADYSDADGPDGVALDLAAGTAADGSGGNDTLKRFDGVVGSDFADTLFGDDKPNMILGGQSGDAINTRGGDDQVVWNNGDGSDTVDTGDGDDTLTVNGSDSEGDSITATFGPGGSTVSRSNHTPFTVTFSAAEHLVLNTLGGSDYVVLDGAAGSGVADATVNLGDNDDVLDGRVSPVPLVGHGDNGNDILAASPMDDDFFGDAGDDYYYTSAVGNDRITDSLGGSVLDFLFAGSGITVDLTKDSGQKQVLNNTGATLTLRVQVRTVYGTQFDDTIIGSDADDLIFGREGNDTLRGGRGNDQLLGDQGADQLFGELGDDTLDGGAGNDSFDGGLGLNLLSYANDPNAVNVRLDLQTATDGYGDGDTFINIQGVIGSFYNDILVGSAGNDVIRGGFGDDTIQGNEGDDTIDGGEGNNTIDTGAGKDNAVAGSGSSRFINDVDLDTLARPLSENPVL